MSSLCKVSRRISVVLRSVVVRTSKHVLSVTYKRLKQRSNTNPSLFIVAMNVCEGWFALKWKNNNLNWFLCTVLRKCFEESSLLAKEFDKSIRVHTPTIMILANIWEMRNVPFKEIYNWKKRLNAKLFIEANHLLNWR